jgi:hypothetical protein
MSLNTIMLAADTRGENAMAIRHLEGARSLLA